VGRSKVRSASLVEVLSDGKTSWTRGPKVSVIQSHMESSADIGLYMCVHIILRYDDTMKEQGGEGRKRKQRDIYIYNLQS